MNQRGNALILGILVGLLVAAGLFGAYYLGTKVGNNTSYSSSNLPTVQPTSTGLTQTPIPSQNSNQKLYTNSQYGFSVSYPSDMKLFTSQAQLEAANLVEYIPPCESQHLISCFYLPQGTFADTTNNDFTSASFWIGTVDLNQQNCVAYKDNDRVSRDPQTFPVTQKQINGVNYSVVMLDGVAAGHQASETDYRVYLNNYCFNIATSIHTESRAENTSPQGTYQPFTQVNRQNVQAILDGILNSLKFNNR